MNAEIKVDHVTHHDALTDEEVDSLRPNQQILYLVEQFAATSNQAPNDIQVLDFGCGNGRLCAFLRRRGFTVFGADIDVLGVETGREYLRKQHLDPAFLRIIDGHGRTDFADGSFDIVLSDQVLEHVEDIDLAADECARLTRPGGFGVHSYPAHHLPVEPHIFIPFAHWLPETDLQEFWIRLCLRFKAPTPWPHLKNLTRTELAAHHAKFLREQTFYRKPAAVSSAFKAAGFDCEQVVVDHPRLRNNDKIQRLLRIPKMREITNCLLANHLQSDFAMVRH